VIPYSYFKFLRPLKLNSNIARARLHHYVTSIASHDYVYLRVTLRDNRIEKSRYSELNQKLTDPLQATPKTGAIIERDI